MNDQYNQIFQREIQRKDDTESKDFISVCETGEKLLESAEIRVIEHIPQKTGLISLFHQCVHRGILPPLYEMRLLMETNSETQDCIIQGQSIEVRHHDISIESYLTTKAEAFFYQCSEVINHNSTTSIISPSTLGSLRDMQNTTRYLINQIMEKNWSRKGLLFIRSVDIENVIAINISGVGFKDIQKTRCYSHTKFDQDRFMNTAKAIFNYFIKG